MPSALLKPCAEPGGCPELVEEGRCATHERKRERFRGSASSRGYTWEWTKFRARFKEQLIAAGIAPVCGAALPGGPSGADSRCMAEGVLEDQRLHLDHSPPLKREERPAMAGHRRFIDDPLRVRFLCASCHSAVTATQMAEGIV